MGFNFRKWVRRPLGQKIIGWIFEHMSFAIPVKRLRETPTLLAFHHPQPVYPLHILLVPKKAIPAFADLGAQDAEFLADLVQTVQSLVEEYHLGQKGYRLVVNGGKFQEFPQLHFHLISDNQNSE